VSEAIVCQLSVVALPASKYSLVLRRIAEISQQKGGVHKQKCEIMRSFKNTGTHSEV
jgi:hypothetical protein